ncbi:MAG: hypothetical protein KF709_13030 [Gemmatimonadaceae bacterium]|nr:hypothetical protein [Gemmatimonadaceae bacterium]
MRTQVTLLSVIVMLFGCAPERALGPAAPSRAEAVASVVPESMQAPAPTIIVCQRFAVRDTLHLVDGKIVSANTARARIKQGRVQVDTLRGAAAVSLYGSRGALGAIVVTTRESGRAATR